MRLEYYLENVIKMFSETKNNEIDQENNDWTKKPAFGSYIQRQLKHIIQFQTLHSFSSVAERIVKGEC